MYQSGDLVIYGIHGVCKILTLEERAVDKKAVEYYVLEPLEQPGARYYVPTHNQVAAGKLRRILSESELMKLLKSKQVQEDAWIADEGQRKQRYRELINSGDRAALISMVHTLHKHREAQQAQGRKFHLCDENFLRDAQKLLDSEFALILGISNQEVGKYITEELNSEV